MFDIPKVWVFSRDAFIDLTDLFEALLIWLRDLDTAWEPALDPLPEVAD
jgi:hypothetical protein